MCVGISCSLCVDRRKWQCKREDFFWLTLFPFIGQEVELEVMNESQTDEDSDVEDPLYGFHVSSTVPSLMM